MTSVSDLPVVFDETGLLEISDACGIPAMELISMFIEDSVSNLEKLDAALAANDHKMAHRQVHSLKSSGANVGALRFSALARDLEAASRDTLPIDSQDWGSRLRVELDVYQQATNARSNALSAA